MTRERLEKFIERQEKISERNYDNYQQSGIGRYDREYRKAEDLLEMARMALSIADIDAENSSIKYYMATWGAKAIEILYKQKYEDKTEDIQQLLRDIKAVCVGMGISTDWSEGMD